MAINISKYADKYVAMLIEGHWVHGKVVLRDESGDAVMGAYRNEPGQTTYTLEDSFLATGNEIKNLTDYYFKLRDWYDVKWKREEMKPVEFNPERVTMICNVTDKVNFWLERRDKE